MDQSQSQSNRSNRSAILIVHGVGQQKRFDTLSGFAAGLSENMQRRHPDTPLGVSRELLKDGNVDSFLRLHRGEGDPQLDIVEYYYQPKLQRQVKREDVVDWLLTAAKRVKQVYRSKGFSNDERQTPGDNYLLTGSVWLLRIMRPLIALVRLLEQFRFASPVANIVKRLIFARLDTVLTDFVGDVVAYTAIDPRLRLNKVREDILSGCVHKLRHLLEAKNEKGELVYDQVIVAGHSLGSMVIYDAVSQINRELQAGCWKIPGNSQRLSGLVTFGSPLDKIAMFFWPLPEKTSPPDDDASRNKAGWLQAKNALYAGLLPHFHGLRGLNVALRGEQPLTVKQPENEPLAHMVWLNFYHPEDLVAGHLDAYEKLTNIKTSAGIEKNGDNHTGAHTPGFPEAHSYYWYDPRMLQMIIDTFLERDIAHAIDQKMTGEYLRPLRNFESKK